MIKKEHVLIPLFQQFIDDSYKGKRLKNDGSKIKKQTIDNYNYVLKYLIEFEIYTNIILRIKVYKGNNTRTFVTEKNYWKRFYQRFTGFLYKNKNFFDNYVGTVIKTLRIFFNYLNRDKGIKTGEFHKGFYVPREEVPIITLMPSQLKFLINDSEFEKMLSKSLQKSKAILVFGCTVALRISDLFSIKFNDLERKEDALYLTVKTMKTGTIVRIKLPAYAISIIENFRRHAKKRTTIFPLISNTRFNSHLKEIAAIAGWTNPTGKLRSKRTIAQDLNRGEGSGQYRFCDLVSSHIMRRTQLPPC